MKIKILGFLALVTLSNIDAQTVALLPKNWDVDLDPERIEQWGKVALTNEAGLIPQQALNQLLKTVSDAWDARLMIVFVRLSGILDDPSKRQLLKEQKEWNDMRMLESNKAAKQEEGGSAAPSAFSEKFIELTKKRYMILLERVSAK